MRRFVWQIAFGVVSTGATIAAGFMLEQLFLDEWTWWHWGSLAAVLVLLTIYTAWKLSKIDAEESAKATAAADLTVSMHSALRLLIAAVSEPDQEKRETILGRVRLKPLPRPHWSVGQPVGKVRPTRTPPEDES